MSILDDFPLIAASPGAKREGEEDFSLDSMPVLRRDPRWQPPEPAPTRPVEEPLGPWDASWKGAGADLRTAGAALLAPMFPETGKGLLDDANKIREEVDRRYKPKVPSFKDIYKEDDLLGSVGRLGQYAYEKAAESSVQTGAGLAGGAAAATLGAPLLAAGAVGTAVGAPFFLGQFAKEQMDEGKKLDEVNLGVAIPAAALAAASDMFIGKLIPGMGKAAAGTMFVRAAKKGAEGLGIEASTEAFQEALQIVQANPQKLMDFKPEVRDRLLEAAVAGGLLGGTVGGVSGVVNPRAAPALTPQAEEPPGAKPGEDSVLTEPPSPSEYFPPPREYAPAGTGLPGPAETTAPGLESGTGLPEFTRNPEWQSIGEKGPRALITKYGETEPAAVAPTASLSKAPESNGQKVFNDIRQQLYAADVNPIQANAAAKLWKARYEALGQQLGVSPFEAYKASNVEIKGSRKEGPQVQPTSDPATVLNQDPIEQAPQVVMRSALTSAANRIKMKEGTGQQWLNALKREGAKDEEIEWSGVKDFLTEFGDKKMPAEALQRIAQPYKLAVYEAKPHDQGKKSHYGQWTLGEYGSNPDSNYREVVVSDESLPQGTYKSDHWQMVPNPLGHYRTTDRTLSNGQNALHMEEAQSDWHQAGRRSGYATPERNRRLEEIPIQQKKINEEYLGTQDENRRRLLRTEWQKLDFEEKRLAQADIAPSPYQQSWPNMLFRHALADAINQDKDVLTWNTGANMPEVEGWGSNADPKKIEAMQNFYDGRIVDYANKLGKPFGVKAEKISIPDPVDIKLQNYNQQRIADIEKLIEQAKERGSDTLGLERRLERAKEIASEHVSHKPKEVWSLPINSAMREVLQAGGLPLFQRAGGTPKGNITIMPDKSIIRIHKTGDISTVMHESAHHWLSEFERYAPKNKDIAQDLTAFKAWAGLAPDGKITTKEHELFARGYEQYLATGKAPNKALKELFEQFRQWMIDIYKRIQNIQKARPKEFQSLKMTPEMRGVYDRMMAFKGEPEASSSREGQPTEGLFQQAKPQGRIAQLAGAAKQLGSDIFDPQSRVPEQREYLGARIEARGDMYRWDEAGKAAMRLYSKLSPADQETVTQFYEGKKAITDVPTALRGETRAIKDRIEKLGQDLVDRKVLKPETYQANKGTYSPRLFMKHFMTGQGLSGGFKPNLGETKKRKDLTMDARMAMGEIRHPGITMRVALARMGRDVAGLDFLGKISKNPEWFHPRSTIEWDGHKVTPNWLKAEAVDVRERAREIKKVNPDQAKEMIDLADRMEETADDHVGGDYNTKEWKQMPDTRQFGALRGGWVRKQIADDITGMVDFSDPQSWAASMLGDKNSMLTRATQTWKVLKVPMNIASHGRNFIGNMIQMNVFGGVPIPKLPKYIAQAAREMRDGKGRAWDVAKQYGVPHGNMGEAEFRALADDLAKTMDSVSLKGPTPFLAAWKVFSQVREKMTDVYQGAESLFKTAVIAHEMDKGTAPKEAALRADDALFDYSRVSPSVKYLRNSPLGAPFLTWQYKALPMLVKTLTDKKTVTRYLPYAAMSALVPALVASMNDLKDDDPERLRKALSEALRRKASMYLLPWKDQNGRWQFLDVGYFLPWQMPQEVFSALAEGKIDEAIKATPLLSSPVISIVTAIKTGTDSFTNHPIMDKRDPPYDQVLGLMKYLWDMATPSVFASYGLAGKAYDNLTGSGTNRHGEPPADWMQIAARGAGLNTYSVDPEAQRARNLNKMQHDLQDIRAQMSMNMKDQSLTMEQRQALAERFQEKMLDRMKAIQTYAKDSEMTPSLRAASGR